MICLQVGLQQVVAPMYYLQDQTLRVAQVASSANLDLMDLQVDYK